ncbi:MAG: hypothetical protein AAF497_15280, partial [Planctomycetota bacterium]
ERIRSFVPCVIIGVRSRLDGSERQRPKPTLAGRDDRIHIRSPQVDFEESVLIDFGTGYQTVVAAGKGGFGALSFRAVKSGANANDDARNKRPDPFRFVSAPQDDLLDLLDDQEPTPPTTDGPADDSADLPDSVEGLLDDVGASDEVTPNVPAPDLASPDPPAVLDDPADAGFGDDPPAGLDMLDDEPPAEALAEEEDLDAAGLQPSFDNFGNPLSAPFCMAIMDDPDVIVQAFRPFVPRAQPQPLAAGAGFGGDFIGGAFAPMPVGPTFGGSPAVMGGNALPAPVAQTAIQTSTGLGGSYYGTPTYSGGFSSVGGGGASIGTGGGTIGSFLGFAGLTAGVTSVAIRASNRGGMFEPRDPLVSPFSPADPPPMMEVDPPIIDEDEFDEGGFFLER